MLAENEQAALRGLRLADLVAATEPDHETMANVIARNIGGAGRGNDNQRLSFLMGFVAGCTLRPGTVKLPDVQVGT